MKVTEFFLVFGPKIWSIQRGETEYGIKCIPAGAYVKIIGMTNLEEVAPEDEARTYRQKSFGQRVSVAVAGSTMHFLLALVLIFVALVVIGQPGRHPRRRAPGQRVAHRRRQPTAPAPQRRPELGRPDPRDRRQGRRAPSTTCAHVAASAQGPDGAGGLRARRQAQHRRRHAQALLQLVRRPHRAGLGAGRRRAARRATRSLAIDGTSTRGAKDLDERAGRGRGQDRARRGSSGATPDRHRRPMSRSTSLILAGSEGYVGIGQRAPDDRAAQPR